MKIVREIMGTKIEIDLTAEEIASAMKESVKNDVVANLRNLLNFRVPESELMEHAGLLADDFVSSNSVLDNEWSRLQETADELNKRYGYRLYEVEVARTVVFKKTLSIRAADPGRAKELAEKWFEDTGWDIDEYDSHDFEDEDSVDVVGSEDWEDGCHCDVDEEDF